MKRRKFGQILGTASIPLVLPTTWKLANNFGEDVRIGIIGLDTSHALAFAKIINAREEGKEGTGFMVTHAYPRGSMDIESSVSRIPGYTEDAKKLGIKITESIKELLDQVEVVLLETNDGRLHLEQAQEVFEAGKPVFIDKPIAASMADVKAIFAEAKKHNVPVWSASSLRFGPATQEVANGKIGDVLGADTYSPAKLEPTHPDLFWYGIHGVESLYTVMGTGCEQVHRIFRDDMEVVTGEWDHGRIGTFRGLRTEKTGYGGTAFGTEGIAPIGAYEGYEHLVWEILKFFKTGVVPVKPEETIELFAFMAAADESKKMGGRPVTVKAFL
ncbi:MAG: Gfo/Idh/MocA family oxidoreductase [Saprospiraceae bacterium]|nr:Gfo/Idh/MocA family oxidoreductase [Saprospiraceae bacterium]